MPGYMTEDEAKAFKCPVARTFDTGKKATCEGASCILWRWKPVTADNPFFQSAVKRKEATLALEHNKGKDPSRYHAQAAKAVSADLEGHGVKSDRGYCGLGGNP